MVAAAALAMVLGATGVASGQSPSPDYDPARPPLPAQPACGLDGLIDWTDPQTYPMIPTDGGIEMLKTFLYWAGPAEDKFTWEIFDPTLGALLQVHARGDALSLPSTLDWTTVTGALPLAPTTVTLADGMERPASIVRGSGPLEGRAGLLTWTSTDDLDVAVVATSSQSCLADDLPALLHLMQLVHPPTMVIP